ncbi:MAG: WbqC family protein [Cyclobacteriaceae bacterium]|nr:WbqC family protein [Cyclobacteriaceae bacterium]
MKSIVGDLFYFPNLEYFCTLLNVNKLYLNPSGLYKRKSFFNRTQIRLANKVETLSVPIVGRRPNIPLGQVEIDYRQKWQKIHLRGIQSAYGKAPFFEYFFPYIEEIFEQKPQFLWDLNQKALTICLKLLQLPVKLEILSEQQEFPDLEDQRGTITPSGHFLERGIYQEVPYTQNFGLDFEPNLSVLDLLFAEGPSAKRILEASLKKH